MAPMPVIESVKPAKYARVEHVNVQINVKYITKKPDNVMIYVKKKEKYVNQIILKTLVHKVQDTHAKLRKTKINSKN